MQKKHTKTAIASNATAASTDVLNELASARALSALCGGSGVGQAPEPPHSAERRAEQLTVNLQQLTQKGKDVEFLPKAPINLQRQINADYKQINADKKGISKDLIYEVGVKEESEQEKKIIARENIKTPKSEKPKEKVRETKVKVGEFKGIIRGKLREFKGKPRLALRFALQTASYACILIAFVGFCFAYLPVMKAEAGYQLKILLNTNQYYQILTNTNKNNTEKVKKVKVLPETSAEEFTGINFPADTSIVIPKIDATAEIVPNVDPADYEEYMAALQKGVAHARGTALPGMKGNAYLFAHSAGNLFDIARFNAVFYLIGKLEKGDEIYVKFGNEKFKYTVIDKKEVDPKDVKFLTGNLAGIEGEEGIGEVGKGDRTLTLQTCVPPGTDWRRLLIFAKIEK
jgi:sortase A